MMLIAFLASLGITKGIACNVRCKVVAAVVVLTVIAILASLSITKGNSMQHKM